MQIVVNDAALLESCCHVGGIPVVMVRDGVGSVLLKVTLIQLSPDVHFKEILSGHQAGSVHICSMSVQQCPYSADVHLVSSPLT